MLSTKKKKQWRDRALLVLDDTAHSVAAMLLTRWNRPTDDLLFFSERLDCKNNYINCIRSVINLPISYFTGNNGLQLFCIITRVGKNNIQVIIMIMKQLETVVGERVVHWTYVTSPLNVDINTLIWYAPFCAASNEFHMLRVSIKSSCSRRHWYPYKDKISWYAKLTCN